MSREDIQTVRFQTLFGNWNFDKKLPETDPGVSRRE